MWTVALAVEGGRVAPSGGDGTRRNARRVRFLLGVGVVGVPRLHSGVGQAL